MAKKKTGERSAAGAADASRLIDARIEELGDWRGEALSRVRKIILRAEPAVFEEWKWDGPVWSHPDCGVICTGEAYKKAVKLTFAKGASLEDPAGLFNASLEGKVRRAIDLHEGGVLDARALAALVRSAIAAGQGSGRGGKAGPRLLSGGNPQIAKGHGDAPVRAYLDAMPGWKRDVGEWIDAIIVRTVPGVRKAVKWNSPLYGAADPGMGWFLSVHCFTKYVKVAFFRGAALRPPPPGASKRKEVRYLDIREDDALDEKRFAAWVKQASRLVGESL